MPGASLPIEPSRLLGCTGSPRPAAPGDSLRRRATFR
jgi:hypothetical protein